MHTAADDSVTRVLEDAVSDIEMEEAAAADSLAASVMKKKVEEVLLEDEVAGVARDVVDNVTADFQALKHHMRAQAESIMQTCNLGLLLGSVQCNAEAFLLRVGH